MLALLVGLAACAVPGTGGGGRITVTAFFSDIDALEHHATVEMSGVSVGRVSHIQVDGSEAKLTLSLRKGAGVPADAVPVIATPTLLGSQVVDLRVPANDHAGPVQDGAVLADAARPGKLEPDLESLVRSGNQLLGVLGAEGTTALARVISENAQGFGPEGGDLRAVLDSLDTVTAGYASRTQTIQTLLRNLDAFTSATGPSAQADAEALTNLAHATEELDRQKDRLVNLLASLSSLGAQTSSFLSADLDEITHQLSALNTVATGLARQQASLGRVVEYLNGHNLGTSRVVDKNDDFTQVLNDFVVCGLPGGGEDPTSPLNSCSNTTGTTAP